MGQIDASMIGGNLSANCKELTELCRSVYRQIWETDRRNYDGADEESEQMGRQMFDSD